MASSSVSKSAVRIIDLNFQRLHCVLLNQRLNIQSTPSRESTSAERAKQTKMYHLLLSEKRLKWPGERRACSRQKQGGSRREPERHLPYSRRGKSQPRLPRLYADCVHFPEHREADLFGAHWLAPSWNIKQILTWIEECIRIYWAKS